MRWFLALCLWLGLKAAAGPGYLIDGNTFRHAELGFSFRIPEGWGARPLEFHAGEGVVELVAPTGRTSLLVVLTRPSSRPHVLAPPSTVEDLEKEMAVLVQGFRLTRSQVLQVESQQVVEFAATSARGTRRHRLAVFQPSGRAVVLWLQTNQETYDVYSPSFDGVVKSLRLENSAEVQES